jgi:hypothetical protein
VPGVATIGNTAHPHALEVVVFRALGARDASLPRVNVVRAPMALGPRSRVLVARALLHHNLGVSQHAEGLDACGA